MTLCDELMLCVNHSATLNCTLLPWMGKKAPFPFLKGIHAKYILEVYDVWTVHALMKLEFNKLDELINRW